MTTITLPNFFIVGAAKSGTTAMATHLSRHPQIFIPTIKEPCFFSSASYTESNLARVMYPVRPNQIVSSLETYKELFSSTNSETTPAIGEASTHYLFQYKETIENMKQIYNDLTPIKIIIILRNPTDAVYSNYSMWRMRGYEQRTFEEVLLDEQNRWYDQKYNIAYIHKFMYSQQIEHYLANFYHVKIFLYDDLKDNPSQMFREIFQFLNVDPEIEIQNLEEIYNPSGIVTNKSLYSLLERENLLKFIVKLFLPVDFRRNIKKRMLKSVVKRESMDIKIRKHLIETFRDDISKTQTIIKRDLKHWLL